MRSGRVEYSSLQARLDFEIQLLRFCLRWGDAPYVEKVSLNVALESMSSSEKISQQKKNRSLQVSRM